MNNWYVIQTLGGYEGRVKEFIEKNIPVVQVLLPMRQLKLRIKGIFHDVLRNLYPGYLFVYGKIDNNFLDKIREAKGFIKVLWNDNDIKPISKKEMDLVFSITGNENIIGFSTGFFEDDRIKVISGPLVGMEGMIKKINKRKHRVKVEFDFFKQPVQIDLGFKFLERAS